MTSLILNEEERMLQSLVRDFADRELAPRARQLDEEERFSWENWEGMARLGLTGIGIDPKYGGSADRSWGLMASRTRSAPATAASFSAWVSTPYLSARYSRRSPTGTGAGLGLPIVQRLVDAWGGSVDVTSVSGEGTTVSIRLKRSDPGD